MVPGVVFGVIIFQLKVLFSEGQYYILRCVSGSG
jgi:hypothetical protein